MKQRDAKAVNTAGILCHLFAAITMMASPITLANTGTAVNAFLLSAHSLTPELTANSKKTRNRASYWLDESELRLGTDSEDEYSVAIRFRPVSPAAHTLETGINHLQRERLTLGHDELLSSQLLERYRQLLDLLTRQAEHHHLEQEVTLIKRRIEHIRGMAQTNSFSPTRLQVLELNYIRLRNRLKLSAEQIRLLDPLAHLTELFIDSKIWLLPVSSLEVQIKTHGFAHVSTDGNLKVKSRRLATALAEARLKQEKTNSKRWLKYIELKHLEKPNQAAETSLGISIPIGRSKTRQIQQQRNLDQSLLTQHRLEFETRNRLHTKSSSLQLLILEANTTQRMIEDIRARLSKHDNIGDPELVLGLKKENLALNRQLWKIRIRALHDYIDCLDLSGKLTRRPLQNWLSVGLPSLM